MIAVCIDIGNCIVAFMQTFIKNCCFIPWVLCCVEEIKIVDDHP